MDGYEVVERLFRPCRGCTDEIELAYVGHDRRVAAFDQRLDAATGEFELVALSRRGFPIVEFVGRGFGHLVRHRCEGGQRFLEPPDA